jgi:anti-sigma factor (TIGR02949 family)
MESIATEPKNGPSEGSQTADCEKVLRILDMIVDGESQAEEETYFFKHLETCKPCFDSHQRQKQLKDLVQGNVKRKSVPANLVSSIKALIKETA